eukprot:TRINITY_DN1815_c0_g4_i1.p1 TRINITY_DN1815_c0_g4~~TRINITY_DN1815_c0_g4_i1.p1  ORF type:complete len:321 (-),score=75.01 TRINITY_DN1815_c0_g4_i1:52-1014(-)
MDTEVHFCTFRIIIALLWRWFIKSDLHWFLVGFHALYAVFTAYRYYRYVPYYNKWVSALYGGCVVLHLWVVFNVALYRILGGDDGEDASRKYKGVSTVIFLGALVISVNVVEIRKQLVKQKVIELWFSEITNDGELDLYTHCLMDLYYSQYFVASDELILRGYLAKHKADCHDPENVLNKPEGEKIYHPATETESGEDVTNSKDKIIILSLINSILKSKIKNRKPTDEVKATIYLTNCNFLFKEMGNVHMATVSLMKARKSLPSIQQSISIYSLSRAIEEYLVKKYKKKPGDKFEDESSKDTSRVEFLDCLLYTSDAADE